MDITVSGYRSILNQVIVVKDLVVNKNIKSLTFFSPPFLEF